MGQNLGDLFAKGPPWATLMLCAIAAVVFGLEWLSGSPASQDTLLQFGAVVPMMVLKGQVWRLLSANFVHIDLSHLGLNMFSLLFLGTLLERHLGRIRMIGVFFASGLGAMLVVVGAYSLAGNGRDLVAGASAAIFGLIGALLAWLSKACHPAVRSIRRRQRWLLLGLLAVQFTYDLWMPDVSFLGHLSGLIIGWIATILIFNPKPESG